MRMNVMPFTVCELLHYRFDKLWKKKMKEIMKVHISAFYRGNKRKNRTREHIYSWYCYYVVINICSLSPLAHILMRFRMEINPFDNEFFVAAYVHQYGLSFPNISIIQYSNGSLTVMRHNIIECSSWHNKRPITIMWSHCNVR